MINQSLVPASGVATSLPTQPNRFSDDGIQLSAHVRAGFGLTQRLKSEKISNMLGHKFGLPEEISDIIGKAWLADARTCVHHMDIVADASG